MCREQLPVWQSFYEEHKDSGIEVLSVAMDIQGAEKARPYPEKAGATFITVVDEDNILGKMYGFKAIPNGLLIDENGVLEYKKYGGFDIRRQETADVVKEWAAKAGDLSQATESSIDGDKHLEAIEIFQSGGILYKDGKVEEAIALWRQAVELEPDNYVIRKQIWAIENPDKFYDGDVDYGWQREQMEKGL